MASRAAQVQREEARGHEGLKAVGNPVRWQGVGTGTRRQCGVCARSQEAWAGGFHPTHRQPQASQGPSLALSFLLKK